METLVSLNKIKPGERATVKKIDGSTDAGRRLMSMGLLKDETIECVGRSPMGDPSAYLVKGSAIAIRAVDRKNILVEPISND